jgi:sensor histidine kinase regulating citrate/malate metabolism
MSGRKEEVTSHLYRIMLDSLSDAIHIIDRDFRIILHNKKLQSWLEKLGLNPEVDGLEIWTAFPFLPDSAREEYRSVFNTAEHIRKEDEVIMGKKVSSLKLKLSQSWKKVL